MLAFLILFLHVLHFLHRRQIQQTFFRAKLERLSLFGKHLQPSLARTGPARVGHLLVKGQNTLACFKKCKLLVKKVFQDRPKNEVAPMS